MSEENSRPLDENATNPVQFEDFVRQQFEMIASRLDRMEKEMVERFVQLSRQGLETREQVVEAREDIRDLDGKVDHFIREHLRIKRDLRELQESLNPRH